MLSFALRVGSEDSVDDGDVLHHSEILANVALLFLLAEEEELLVSVVEQDELLGPLFARDDLDVVRKMRDVHLNESKAEPISTSSVSFRSLFIEWMYCWRGRISGLESK